MGWALVLSSLLYFVVLEIQIKACNGCIEKERRGLIEMKAYFVAQSGDIAESELVSWVDDRSSNCCFWDRLKCGNLSTGHVTELSLNELHDSAKLSTMLNFSLLTPFQELVSLNLSGNMCQDWIGNEGFSSLKKLEALDLSSNYLNTSILLSLNGLASLRILKLNANWMDSYCSAKGVSSLKKLETLDLSSNNLNTSIVPWLSGLTSLRTLNLHSNSLNGSFPALGLQNLKSLKALDLSRNSLNGSIKELCKMKDVVKLDLSDNMFSGQIPECLSILRDLRVLDLSQNFFNGKFPSFVSNMTSLIYLSLFNNYLEGSFSLSILANHSQLEVLYISSQSPGAQVETENIQWFSTFQLKSLMLRSCNLNMYKGSIVPSFLQDQKELQYIDLSHNKLVGAFPSWLVQNNSRLETFLLMSNSLMGNLHLSAIRQDIFHLDISNNNISGLLPNNIGTFLPRIMFLNLSMNNFEGNIPASIGKMQMLRWLDLSHNHFSGELPQELTTQLFQPKFLKLSNNLLQGNIVDFSNFLILETLDLNSNNLSGTIKEVLENLNSKVLWILDISNNSISGEIPSSIGKFSSLRILLLAKNQLEGKVPFEFSNLTMLFMLDLSQNRLVGLVSCFNVSSMHYMYLQKNNFSGSIPITFSEGSQLISLDLGNNNFSGNIPYWMDKLSNIKVLLLGRNNFHGHIPIQLCELKNITIMDLSHNKINGSIPSCFSNLKFGIVQKDSDDTRIQFQRFIPYIWTRLLFDIVSPSEPTIGVPFSDEILIAAEFITKGNSYSYKGNILENMTGMDLSCNMLTGIIPSQIGNLQQIHSMNLSHNLLSGFIPSSFSNLTQIESLDLSYNNLSGEIPSQLTQLNFLSIFNVSYNNLSGTPPNMRQFGSFDEENYRGNPGLCGPLLKRKCEGAIASPPSQSSNSKEKETTLDMVAFTWSFCASYIIMLFGIIIVLYINGQWLMAWFYYVNKLIGTCFPSFLV